MSNPLIGLTAETQVQQHMPDTHTNSSPQVTGAFVIDGTPIRVAVLGLSAALTIAALRWSGFKFNVGVST